MLASHELGGCVHSWPPRRPCHRWWQLGKLSSSFSSTKSLGNFELKCNKRSKFGNSCSKYDSEELNLYLHFSNPMREQLWDLVHCQISNVSKWANAAKSSGSREDRRGGSRYLEAWGSQAGQEGQAMHMEIGSQGRPGAAHTKASFSPFASLQSDPLSSCFVTPL